MTMCDWGLYVHIPFCRRKCNYCDFPSYAGMQSCHADYIRTVQREIETVSSDQTARFDTIFVGGGTPTVVGAERLVGILQACREHLDIAAEAEITVEANPGTVNLEELSTLHQAGVNRLSLGVQSLHDRELEMLGRIHSAQEAIRAYHMARCAGLANINIDLIFGLPGQSIHDWRDTLERAMPLHPEHLSLYALTVEEGTPLASWLHHGQLPAIDDALAADMYELAECLLAREGYVHYEISNWADQRNGVDAEGVPKLACAHNLKYWRNQPYLGLGAAAHSYDGQRRTANTVDPADYMARVWAGQQATVQSEFADADQRMGETMMLGLRLTTGVSEVDFERRFGTSLGATYGREIDDLIADGLLARDERGVRLTPRGRLLGNRVFAAFLR
jgi:oxygen-independent coproporphyrinogen-3 oxidase